MSKVDFWVISTMEVWHYAPVIRALRANDVDTVVIQPQNSIFSIMQGWDDPWRIEKLLRHQGLPYLKSPRLDAEAVVSTQCGAHVVLYKGKKVRMMYGVDLVGCPKPIRWADPFDLHLVHGPQGQRVQFSQHYNASPDLPPDKVKVIGYPKLDPYFQSLLAHDQCIFYLPTWGERSSIDKHAATISKMCGRKIAFPHHMTRQEEPERLELLRGLGFEVADELKPLNYKWAKLIFADAQSGVFPESVLTGIPVATVDPKFHPDIDLLNRVDVPRSVDDWFTTTRGHDGEVAAQAIMELL